MVQLLKLTTFGQLCERTFSGFKQNTDSFVAADMVRSEHVAIKTVKADLTCRYLWDIRCGDISITSYEQSSRLPLSQIDPPQMGRTVKGQSII